jgi:hypothetical protein
MPLNVLPDFVLTVTAEVLAMEAAMSGQTQEQAAKSLLERYRDGLAKKNPNAVFGVQIKVE